jgi:hypothetical protein
VADTLDWIRWTMRTRPLAEALTEHAVGDLGRYALKSGLHVVVEGAVLARADPRARGYIWVTGGAARPGHRAGGRAALASDHRGSATTPCLPPDK